MRAVNLLPRDIAAEGRSLKDVLPVVGAAAVPMIAASLVFIGYARAHADAAQQLGQVAALEQEIARATPATVTKTVDTSALVSSRAARRSALADALSKQIAWDRALGDVARVLPNRVWLNDMTVVSPTPADKAAPTPAPVPATGPSSGPSGFIIDGYTYTMEDVALLLQRLQLLPTLTNVTLTSTSGSTIGDKPVVQFSISASIAVPATALTPVVAPPTTTTPATTTEAAQ